MNTRNDSNDCILCFVCGSNLNEVDLRHCCQVRKHRMPLGRSVGRAVLPDKELCFDYKSGRRSGGVLDVRPRKSS